MHKPSGLLSLPEVCIVWAYLLCVCFLVWRKKLLPVRLYSGHSSCSVSGCFFLSDLLPLDFLSSYLHYFSMLICSFLGLEWRFGLSFVVSLRYIPLRSLMFLQFLDIIGRLFCNNADHMRLHWQISLLKHYHFVNPLFLISFLLSGVYGALMRLFIFTSSTISNNNPKIYEMFSPAACGLAIFFFFFSSSSTSCLSVYILKSVIVLLRLVWSQSANNYHIESGLISNRQLERLSSF